MTAGQIIATALSVLAGSVPTPANSVRPPAPKPHPIVVTATLGGAVRTIPRSFLGFSVEWTELPAFDAQTAAFGRLLRLLSVSGQPVPVRLGGETADDTYWPRNGQRVPRDAFVVDRDYFTRLAELARAAPLSLLFDMNLGARSASMAQSLGRELHQRLPASSVDGFEIGNEPDLYVIGVVANQYVKPGGRSRFQWVLRYSPAKYASDFTRYVRAVRRIWPHVRYAGPALISGRTSWAQDAIATGALSMLTVHRYQFNVCHGPKFVLYPSVRKYLDPAATRQFAAGLQPFVALATGAGVPLRLTELGSAVCGGKSGLTDTFATALWGADVVFELLAEGIDGINVHLRESLPNSALNATPEGITVNPLYYGMLLATRTLGPGAQLLQTDVTPAAPKLSVWSVRDRRGALRVLLLNQGNAEVDATLNLGVAGTGTLERLSAPRPAATDEVTFDGRSLDPSGRWIGVQQTDALQSVGRIFPVTVPSYSAALLTVRR